MEAKCQVKNKWLKEEKEDLEEEQVKDLTQILEQMEALKEAQEQTQFITIAHGKEGKEKVLITLSKLKNLD